MLAEARIGYRWATGDVDVRVGAPDLEEFNYDSGSVFGRVLYDSLDNLSFPTSGGIVLAEYDVFRNGLGGDDDFEQLRTQLNYIRTFGAHTVGVGARFNSTTSGDAPIQNLLRMGGFLDLSGLPQDYLSGQHTALVQAVYYRRAPLIPFFQWYVGSSLELGNAWESMAPPWRISEWLNAPVPLDLEAQRGHVVVACAFQMLCPGCVSHAIPQLKAVYELFAPLGAVVVGLHTVFEHHEAMTTTALRAFLHEYRVRCPVGVDAPAEDGTPIPQTMAAYRMQGTPTFLLIDRRGHLSWQVFGHLPDLQLGAEIMQLLSESSDPDSSTGCSRPTAATARG